MELLNSQMKVTVERSLEGIFLNVHTHPSVERFLAGLYPDHAPEYVTAWGRQWSIPSTPGVAPDGDPEPATPHTPTEALRVYIIPADWVNTTMHLTGELAYSLAYPGNRLYITNDDVRNNPDRRVLNLSFIRLAGTSASGGVSFFVQQVMQEDSVRQLGRDIQLALRGFYLNYLRPMKIEINVVAQELR